MKTEKGQPELLRKPVTKFSAEIPVQNSSEIAVASSENGYVAKYGQGYNWFSNEGLNRVERTSSICNPQADVVLNFGVNDLYNISRYIQLYQQLMTTYSAGTFLYHVCQSGGR